MAEYFTGGFAFARQIGDHLLLRSQKNPSGFSWETPMDIFDKQAITFSPQEDLASGSAGISLFLLELFNVSKDEKYLNTALEGIRWAVNYSMSHLMPNAGLMNGNMGIVLVLLKAHTLTGHQSYLDRALMMAGRAMGHKHNCRLNYGEGISGALIVLMRLYEKTNDQFILSQIHECFDRLLTGFHTGEIGIFWEQSYHHPSANSGFMNGEPGIAHTLLEAGRYFKDPGFFYWADQSIRHEIQVIRSKKLMPDSSKGRLHSYQDYEQALRFYGQNKTLDNPEEKHNYTGLARVAFIFLKAGYLLETEEYSDEGIDLLNSSLAAGFASGNDFSLGTGLVGLGDVLLEINKFTNDPKLIELTAGIANKICDQRASVLAQNDLSLMTGMTGIGYFLLRQHHSVESFCLLKTSQDYKNTEIPFTNGSFLKQEKMILEKKYPRTLFLLGKLLDPTHPVLNSPDFAYYFNSEERFAKLLDLFPMNVQQRLADVFNLEQEKYRYQNTLDSPAINHIKYLHDRLAIFQPQNQVKGTLSLDNSIRFHDSKWHWDEQNKEAYIRNFEIRESQIITMFWPVANDLVEMKINPFTHAVMECFEIPNNYNDAFATIKDALDISDTQSLKIAEEKFDKQIEELLANRILIQELTIN